MIYEQFPPSVLTAVVSAISYEADEVAEFVTACVNVTGGDLARPVSVIVNTQDDCAEGV
jgi:hypothetical protein